MMAVLAITPLTVSYQILHLSSAEMLWVGADPRDPCHAIRAGMQVLGMGCGICASALIVAHTGTCIWPIGKLKLGVAFHGFFLVE